APNCAANTRIAPVDGTPSAGNEAVTLTATSDFGKGGDQLHLRLARRHLRAALPAEVHVDLAPDPELSRKVDSRLHRQAHPRHQDPLVVGLVVVEVRARPAHVPVDRMPAPAPE